MKQMQRRGGAVQGKPLVSCSIGEKPLFSCSVGENPLFSCSVGENPLFSCTIGEGLMLSIYQWLSLLLVHCLGLQMEEGKRYASMDGDADRIVYYTLKDGEWKRCASVIN